MRRAIGLWLWTGVALSSALGADGGPAGAAAIAPARVGIGPVHRSLTLNQAIELAMRINLDIAIERTNVDSANQAIQSARGAFDPALSGTRESITPTADASLIDSTTGVVTQHSAGQTLRCMNRAHGAD